MKYFRFRLFLFLVLLGMLTVLSGCRKNEERRNLGVDDGINSFLYNFDPRDEVAALVKAVKRGEFPKEITWHYDRNIQAKKNHKVPLRTTADKDTISDIYYALGDAIVVGIANDQSFKTPIDLTFVLSDGTECTFHFVQENTIRISAQNYVLEADGKLWRILETAEATVETEAYPETEGLTETEPDTEMGAGIYPTTEA